MSLRALTPSVSFRTRLAGAALVWSAVGTGLFVAGLRWSVSAGTLRASAAVGAAIVIGAAKGLYLLAPRADANADRIEGAGERRCVGGLFSRKAWLFVAAMMALGAVLRASALPRPLLGALYVSVGTALLAGSITAWRRFASSGRGRVSGT